MNKNEKANKSVFHKVWDGIIFVVKHPLILVIIFLPIAFFLSKTLIVETFSKQMKCSYLITEKLAADPHVCEGIDVNFEYPQWIVDIAKTFGKDIGTKIDLFTLPGLQTVMDPPLRFIRSVVAWTILVFFAMVSLFLTITFNNLKTIVKIILLNKEEWKRFLSSLRTWLLIFSAFCLTFYLSVINPELLKPILVIFHK
jgi:hypothetical protein